VSFAERNDSGYSVGDIFLQRMEHCCHQSPLLYTNQICSIDATWLSLNIEFEENNKSKKILNLVVRNDKKKYNIFSALDW
jgi:hypothetical protein